MRTSARIAVIGGDGIGPEVVEEGLKVLTAAVAADGVAIEATHYDLGAARWHRTGQTLPDEELAELRDYDAILLGAVGDPSVPSGVLERGLLLKLRFAFEHAVNLRPVKLYPGVATPLAGVSASDIDMIVVREGTEGPYVGVGGAMREDTAQEVATENSINTRYGVERVVRDAFTRAASRPRRLLTLVHKTNVLTHAGSLWRRTVEAVNPDFPDVTVQYAHVDAACLYLVTQPQRFDVLVTDNLFGDIITDLGAAIAGGMGLAASGNLNVDGSAPSMFEPVHGSAPDIAGQGIADPTATVLSVSMLLDALSLPDAAKRVEAAVAADLADRGDSTRGTAAIGDAIAARLT
ncbi:MAG TPA: 3-isopropylmalate dehydrogenase [Mycobacteriales bacterium]|nr:3-isopropylmalate dehydrogenase [Mycobacteriales bacterium]